MNAKQRQELVEQQENPELQQPMNLYLEDSFKEYVKEKYLVENLELLQSPQIMQMFYALEWYDIPRSAYTELVEFHPYLTVGDDQKLFYIKWQHRVENFISFSLFSMIANRLLMNRTQLFKRRLFRVPGVLGISGLLTYAFNVAILRPIFLHDLQQMGLEEKYFYLDLNADLMKDDLKQLGFKIDAKHFNLEQVESRLQEQDMRNEADKTK